MKKFFFVVLTTVFSINFSFAHVNHYQNLKYLKYDLFFNNKQIGSHIFNFDQKGKLFYVNSKGSFKVSKLGVVIMNYNTETEEVYRDGDLIKFTSKTTQNDKKKYANIFLKDKNTLNIDGSSFKGEINKDVIVGSWWNHQIIKNSKQISPISGRIIPQKVNFIGKEDVFINNKNYKGLHLHFLSDDDKPINKKKINMHVWYDSETFLWIKTRYENFGTWEYRLNTVVKR